MSFLLSLVPIIMFVYIVFMLRRTPLLFASLPLFFSLGEAGFINGWRFRLTIPFFFTFTFVDVSILLLAIAAFHASRKWPILFNIPKCYLSSVIKLIFVVIVLYIPMAWLVDVRITIGTILSPRYYLYLPISVFLWLSIFRRCNPSHLNTLFCVLLQITFVGAILYSLSSVGLSIFPYTGWQSGQGFGTVTRDFLTFPPYMLIGLGYILFSSNVKLRKYALLYLFVFFIAVLLSYTRSWILAFIVSIFITLLFDRSKGKKGFLLLLMPVIIYSSFTFLQYFAPQNTEFLLSRFSDVSTSSLPINAESRVSGFIEIHQQLSPNNLFAGVGFSQTNVKSFSQLSLEGVFVGDSFWTQLFLQLGYLGVALFLFLFVIMLIYSLTILSSRKYKKLPNFLKMSCVASIWPIARSTASSELLWYPVIYGLVISSLILTFIYFSISFRYSTSNSFPLNRRRKLPLLKDSC